MDSDPLASFRSALEILDEANDWNPDLDEEHAPLYWYALGERLTDAADNWSLEDKETRLHLFDKGIEALSRAADLDVDTTWPAILTALGSAYNGRGATLAVLFDAYPEAFLDFDEALKYSQQISYYVARARAAYRIGAWQCAYDDYCMYIQKGLNPKLRQEAEEYIPLIRSNLDTV